MKVFQAIPLVFLLRLAFLFLLAFPFMWLWNYAIVSALTIAKPIGYWIAVSLMTFVSMFLAGSRSSSK